MKMEFETVKVQLYVPQPDVLSVSALDITGKIARGMKSVDDVVSQTTITPLAITL